MIRMPVVLLIAAALALPADWAHAVDQTVVTVPAQRWDVATSLKATLTSWARREGWPAPQFLTDADWPVDVQGSLPGTIEGAIRALVEGFSRAPIRPRIELSVNHVIVVTEMETE